MMEPIGLPVQLIPRQWRRVMTQTLPTIQEVLIPQTNHQRMITWKLKKQGRRLLVLICNFIGTFKQIKTLALYRYLLTELALSTVAKVDHMLVQKVYTDLSNNQHQLRLFKVGNLKTIKLENQLDREHMQSCMFAITKYQCGNLQ